MLKMEKVKCKDIIEAATESLNREWFGEVYVAFHVTTEVHDIKDVHAGMGSDITDYDHCYLFSCYAAMKQFLHNTKSVIHEMDYVKKVYSVEEYIGTTISVDYDEEADEVLANIEEIDEPTVMEIEVYDAETFETCGVFDNGKDAVELAEKLRNEEGDRRINIKL